MKTHTRGNIIVEDIKVGDIHYEYEYGVGLKCEVITSPTLNESGQYEWKSKNVNTGKVIDYLVDPKYSLPSRLITLNFVFIFYTMLTIIFFFF